LTLRQWRLEPAELLVPLMRPSSASFVCLCLGPLVGAQVVLAQVEPPPENTEVSTVDPAPTEPLAEVVVRVGSGGQRLRESARAVKVVEAAEARRHTADAGEVLARTEGVAVQRSGGLGSESRLSLHGLTGDQIRVFLDGVPLEFSGFGFGIATVPVGWVERFEIYRGVVPVRLGIDALGGAIDIVTDQNVRGSRVVGSYATGAFDTHQLALNARSQHAASGLLARVSGFYDTSDNDYLIDVRVPDELGRLSPARVRRFHDGYRAGGGRVELGWVDRPWARSLLLQAFATSFDKELQHNVNMSVPYGEATYGQTSIGGTLRYEQPRLGESPFDVSALVGYAYRRIDFEDTSRWVYDWFGNRVFERSEGSGETSPFATDSTQWEHRILARLGTALELSELQRLRLVVAPDLTTRTGTERLRVNPDRIDPLTSERQLLQVVAGLEHSYRDLDDVIENDAFAKYYLYRPATDQVQVFDNSIRHIEDSEHRLGAGDAFRAWLLPWLLGKASYEYATRLPRPDEVFGDGSLVVPNLELSPETGHNVNVGALAQANSERLGNLSIEGSGFLRHTEDVVVRLLAEDRIHSIHQNVGTARTLGVDGAAQWASAGRLLTLQLNATWQDQRNLSDRGAFAPFDGERIPNRPWLFANGSASLRLPQLGAPNAELSVSWVTRYVHEFLAGWEGTATADDNSRIPAQLTHSIGAVYSVHNPWTVEAALDLSNVTNERVYDVLGVQRPGRAAFFKLTIGWSRGEATPPPEPAVLN
jgi:vitamin B12 transporter